MSTVLYWGLGYARNALNPCGHRQTSSFLAVPQNMAFHEAAAIDGGHAASSEAADDEPAPCSQATRDAPGPLRAAGRPASGRSKCGMDNTTGSVVQRESKAPTSAMNALRVISSMNAGAQSAAAKARAERERQQRMKDAKLSFDELFAARETEQARSSLKDVDTLQRDLKKVRYRLRRADRMLLDPDGWFCKMWDFLTLFALTYTIFITPYEIGFLAPETTSLALEISNYFILLVFTLGICIQFFIPYRESFLVGGAKIKNHKKIAKRYLRSWFILDFISTFPYEMVANIVLYGTPRSSINLDVEVLVNGTGDTSGDVALRASGSLRLLRLLRIMRLLKLGRIARVGRIASRIADRAERYVSISYTTRTLVFWTLLMVILVHWFCCIWGIVGLEQGSQRSDELEALRLSTFEPADSTLRRALKSVKLPVGGGSSSVDGTSVDVSDIVDCLPGPLNCLSNCELRLLAFDLGNDYIFTAKQESWICRAVAEGKVPADVVHRHFELYMYLLQAFGLISTPESLAEYAVFFILSFLFLVVSNVFVGVIAAVQSEADRTPNEIEPLPHTLYVYVCYC